MTLDPKDCIHWVGINHHYNEELDEHRFVPLDKDDYDLLDENGSVPFNYCPWCGTPLQDVPSEDIVEDDVIDDLPEASNGLS